MNLKTVKQPNAQFMRTMENVDASGMSDPSGTQTIVQKYVLVFDLCSSTSILENLKDYEPEAWLLGFRLTALPGPNALLRFGSAFVNYVSNRG